ncbi:Hypothetical protein, predicted transmembrane protein [Mycoplasma capricolum subsp. capricolum 14232]|uniref:Uncharacterized protein n=1 Tax=Mycoplasma capricolum subsp. capricolum 14232 TaxID=1188238 RepID=A0A084EM73_MYCCA|nr:Hypothetical protein, predicted transmembrane protein [Mycoplasma capricolum subsp. capricolum 14232]
MTTAKFYSAIELFFFEDKKWYFINSFTNFHQPLALWKKFIYKMCLFILRLFYIKLSLLSIFSSYLIKIKY